MLPSEDAVLSRNLGTSFPTPFPSLFPNLRAASAVESGFQIRDILGVILGAFISHILCGHSPWKLFTFGKNFTIY